MLVATTALLALTILAWRGAAAEAPALSPELRLRGPDGDWRPEERFGLYDRSAYLDERALAYATADLPGEAGNAARIIAARVALDAVRAAPADAYAWTLLATVSATNGLTEFARTALQKSRALAPNSVGLTVERLLLLPIEEEPLDTDERTAVVRDLITARERRGRELGALLDAAPGLDARLTTLASEEAAAEAERAAAAAAASPAPAPSTTARPPARTRRGGRTATTQDP